MRAPVKTNSSLALRPEDLHPWCMTKRFLNQAVAIFALIILAVILVAAPLALAAQHPLDPRAVDQSASVISVARLMGRISALAHDSMLGRKPGHRGGTITTEYLSREMRRIGLEPARLGQYLQPVRLRTASAKGSVRFTARGQRIALIQDRQVIIGAIKPGPHRISRASLVLVGHGIVAPEFRWDDYKGANLAGNIAVILDGEPASLTSRGFAPNASSTYHGMWFLRARHAIAHGAAGVIIVRGGSDSVHAVRARRTQHSATIGDAPSTIPEPPVTVVLSASGADRLARSIGDSIAGWRQRAKDSAFTPSLLPVMLDADFVVNSIPFTSHNVIGIIPGSDPALRSECVVYAAHWDAYGVGPPVNGDSIYNGALDNAAGVSTMLAIAEATRALPRTPARTTVFLATTAEESGMLGADAYVANPVCPMDKTVLAIGMDWTWTWGRTDTISSNGFGYSTVDSAAGLIARRMGKKFVPGWSDYWMASDQSAFLTKGVPSWFGGLDGEVTGKPRGWALEQLSSTQTHVPSDEILPTWDMSGAVEEARFLYHLGVHAAEMHSPFRWTADSEFYRAARASRPP
ncbi:MAG: M28 family peptidase [Gemmatimonadaceae bacterium]